MKFLLPMIFAATLSAGIVSIASAGTSDRNDVTDHAVNGSSHENLKFARWEGQETGHREGREGDEDHDNGDRNDNDDNDRGRGSDD